MRAESLGATPFNLFSAEIVSANIKVGGESVVTVRNTGTVTWSSQDPILLATCRPCDRRDSPLFHESWISPNRLCTFAEQMVPPGETATFRFRTQLIASDSTECLQFVAEGHCWLPNTEFEVRAT